MNESYAYDLGMDLIGGNPVYSVDENGQLYCCIGNTRIKVIEHFPQSGKTIIDLIGDMILADARLDG